MKKIIYSATDGKGNKKSGYIDAENNKKALERLRGMGLANITLHDDEFTALSRAELNGLSQRELEKLACLEVAIRTNPGLKSIFYESIALHKLPIIIGIGILLFGYFKHDIIFMVIGLFVALSMPLLVLFNLRRVNAYNRLLIAIARGQWQECLKLLPKLRRFMKAPEMAFDLDIREACIIARTKSLHEALNMVEHWKAKFEAKTPGLFEARIAPVYLAAGSSKQYVEKMREAHAKSPDSPTSLVDLALAEACCGDADRAEKVLSSLAVETLPPHGRPYVAWIEGLIAKRKNRPEAARLLAEAVAAMLPYGNNPAYWPTLAVCTGAWAAVLADLGQVEKARETASKVWEVLKVHGNRELLKELSEKIPGLVI